MRPKSNKRHPFHGINTLIQDIPETLHITERNCWHGKQCKNCMDYETCLEIKGNIAESQYCHFLDKKFRPKELIGVVY